MVEWGKNKLSAKEFKVDDGILYWREIIYKSIVLIVSVLGLPAYAFGMYMSFRYEVYSVAVIDTIVYGSLLYLCIYDPFKLKTKVIVLLSITLMIGASLILILGPYGAGLSYFLAFIILSSMLLGVQGAILGLSIHLFFTIMVAIGISQHWFGNLQVGEYTTMGWLTIAVNSFVICSITSIPLSILLEGLIKYIKKHNTLELALKDKVVQLAKAKNEEENANQLKTKFLANMSHEVRTPLNVILGFSEIVQAGLYTTDTERNQFLKTISQNGKYLLNIIENILDISMIESNQLKYTLLDVSIEEFMEELKDVYHINHSDVEIVFKPDNNIPKTHFKTDQTRLKQVLINLINNAIKYTQKGEVSIENRIEENNIRFIVSDTGVGIHPDNINQIFERFVKFEGENQVKDGTGLGLAISKSIIETLGGTICVQSQLNKGSVFTVTLPIESNKVPVTTKSEDTLVNY